MYLPNGKALDYQSNDSGSIPGYNLNYILLNLHDQKPTGLLQYPYIRLNIGVIKNDVD